MLGSFAAHQGTASLHAALGHALDDLGNFLRDVLAAGDVIQENQRLGTGADHVVDAHGHAVVPMVSCLSTAWRAQLGTHAVGAGDQDRMLHTRAIQLKQAAEAAQPATCSSRSWCGRHAVSQFDRTIPGRNIHACSGVTGRIAFPWCTPYQSRVCGNTCVRGH